MGVRRVFIGWRLRIGSPSLALLGQAVDKHPVHRVQAREYSNDTEDKFAGAKRMLQ